VLFSFFFNCSEWVLCIIFLFITKNNQKNRVNWTRRKRKSALSAPPPEVERREKARRPRGFQRHQTQSTRRTERERDKDRHVNGRRERERQSSSNLPSTRERDSRVGLRERESDAGSLTPNLVYGAPPHPHTRTSARGVLSLRFPNLIHGLRNYRCYL